MLVQGSFDNLRVFSQIWGHSSSMMYPNIYIILKGKIAAIANLSLLMVYSSREPLHSMEYQQTHTTFTDSTFYRFKPQCHISQRIIWRKYQKGAKTPLLNYDHNLICLWTIFYAKHQPPAALQGTQNFYSHLSF